MDLQDPPGATLKVLADKATNDRGFALTTGRRGPWLGYASTTASGEVWIAGVPPTGPFAISVTHVGVAVELARTLAPSVTAGPGAATFQVADDAALTKAVDRVWQLARSLPPTPLEMFEAATAGLPRATESERLVVQRIGQDTFREALLLYWAGRCPLTGITDTALLRASHIIPWKDCVTDAERLDANNGLLLSSLWDAAFDDGLVTFADDGHPIASPLLTACAVVALGLESAGKIETLTDGHRGRLAIHRDRIFRRG
jgi:hypothetical protein